VAPGQRTVTSGGRPGAKWFGRERNADVSEPGLRAGGATAGSSELKSLTRNSAAARRGTALLRGRKLRLPWRIASGSRQPMWRPMSAIGKESVAHSHSPFKSLPGCNSGQGFSVSSKRSGAGRTIEMQTRSLSPAARCENNDSPGKVHATPSVRHWANGSRSRRPR